MSRLSKRITRNPRAASWRQNSSSQMHHLGAEPHDQQQGFRGGIAEDFVAKVDAVGVADLRRLMDEARSRA